MQIATNGKLIEFEIDTGAGVSTITLTDKRHYFPDLKIKQQNVIFSNFDQSTSTLFGIIDSLNISIGVQFKLLMYKHSVLLKKN